MFSRHFWIAGAVCFWGWVSIVSGGTNYVSVSGDDTWDGLAAAWDGEHGPKKTIQAGIDAASAGDTVQAAPGTYLEHILFKGKNIVLTSNNPGDWSVVEATVIQGDGTGSVVTFTNGETRDAVLAGFTITGGIGTLNDSLGEDLYFGGGIYCCESSPTIRNNIIRGNVAPQVEPMGYGGGIGCLYSQAKITNNILADNDAAVGGGACCLYGDMVFQGNVVYDNSAMMAGGAVFIGGHITSNTIFNNEALEIGNLYLISMGVELQIQSIHNIISGARTGGGIGVFDPDDQLQFAYNNVWGNTGGEYLQFPDQTGSNGNISANPLFMDAENGNYHLQVSSPCIQAGNPAYPAEAGEQDMDGDNRVSFGRIDIGADEYHNAMIPVADAGADQIQLVYPVTVTLDGSGSQDPSGIPLHYSWEQTGGPAIILSDPHLVNPVFTANDRGIYVFRLTVSNGTWDSFSDTVRILVGNQCPAADAGADRITVIGKQIFLDGSDSRDDDGDALSHTWRQLSGPELILAGANSVRVGATCLAEGDYVLELEVTDEKGERDTDTVEIRCVHMDIYLERFDPGSKTLEGKYYHYPDIDGYSVIYSVGSACDYTWAIGQKDLLTGTVISISSPGADNHPKIDNDIMVWCAAGDGFGNPWYHEPSNAGIVWQYFGVKNSYSIKTLRRWTWTESYSHPAISGRNVVWVEHVNVDPNPLGSLEANRWYNTPYNICGADITNDDSPIYFTIVQNAGTRDPYPFSTYAEDFDSVVDIDGHLVVWENNGDIYGADISDLNAIDVFPICIAAGRQFDPAISGHLVVWTDQRHDAGDIYGADISNRDDIEVLSLVREPGNQQQAAIDTNLIVYVTGGKMGQIQFCRLSDDHRVFLFAGEEPLFGGGPAIDNHRVVWQDGYYGQVQGVVVCDAIHVIDGPVQNITQGHRYATIPEAILVAQPGDILEVDPGVHVGNLQMQGKTFTLRSADPAYPEATILQGTGNGPVITFLGTETSACIVEGFTITGGDNSYSGGGVSGNHTHAVLRHCVLTGNRADWGGGVCWFEGQVEYCRIVGNHANIGGGGMGGCKAAMRHCLIAGNTADQEGGGIDYGPKPGGMWNCTIAGNSVLGSGTVGGIKSYDGSIVNCIIWGNTGGEIAASSLPSYSCFPGGVGGGNINTDPLFADAASGDYHLKSAGWRWDPARGVWKWDELTSPCIDAGNPGTPLGEEPMSVPADPQNQFGENVRVEMGAYGGTAEASMGPKGWSLLTDITNDGTVNEEDLQVFQSLWLQTGSEKAADFNRDGKVNNQDLLRLRMQWLNSVTR